MHESLVLSTKPVFHSSRINRIGGLLPPRVPRGYRPLPECDNQIFLEPKLAPHSGSSITSSSLSSTSSKEPNTTSRLPLVAKLPQRHSRPPHSPRSMSPVKKKLPSLPERTISLKKMEAQDGYHAPHLMRPTASHRNTFPSFLAHDRSRPCLAERSTADRSTRLLEVSTSCKPAHSLRNVPLLLDSIILPIDIGGCHRPVDVDSLSSNDDEDVKSWSEEFSVDENEDHELFRGLMGYVKGFEPCVVYRLDKHRRRCQDASLVVQKSPARLREENRCVTTKQVARPSNPRLTKEVLKRHTAALARIQTESE